MLYSPLDQFEIRNLLSLDLFNAQLSLTNIGLYLIIAGLITYSISWSSCKTVAVRKGLRGNPINEVLFASILNIVVKNNGQIFYPFIFTLFVFILINNLVGLVPYSFASTSHFVVTFGLSFTVVIGATILGLNKHGLKFFSLFVPSGVPVALLPLLVCIELISYVSRPLSLGLRLGCNICAGHLLLHILSTFTFQIMSSGIIFFIAGLLPLSLIIAFTGLEFAIALVQAYVFVVLTCSYIKDALDLH